ncbi:MAG: YHYH protein [Polyangiaceae bacterium]
MPTTQRRSLTLAASLFLVSSTLLACGDDSGTGASGGAGGESSQGGSGSGGDSSAGGASACALAADTTPSGVENPDGCALLDRDTSSCQSAREALGLTGFWLNFSCRVTLSVANGVVTASSDGQPDYASNYFPVDDGCHEDFTGRTQNPNWIEAFDLSVDIPTTTDEGGGDMTGAVVGLAANGVAIFGNFAAPGDDIYKEAETFDRCGGHPQMAGQYHYHAEPYALSYEDSRFVGVLRDGYPVYGRYDEDGSLPTLDADGGHLGTTPDSPDQPVYHYHVHEETSQTPGTAGQTEWFITTGTYHGTPL